MHCTLEWFILSWADMYTCVTLSSALFYSFLLSFSWRPLNRELRPPYTVLLLRGWKITVVATLGEHILHSQVYNWVIFKIDIKHSIRLYCIIILLQSCLFRELHEENPLYIAFVPYHISVHASRIFI